MAENSNIRSVEKFRQAFWEWAPYNSCFISAEGQATGIRISDIDGHVERNGHFLWIETSEKQDISIGQMRSIKRRAARGDTVVILQGKPNAPEFIQIFRPYEENSRRYVCDAKMVAVFFRGWMLWAELNGFVNPSKYQQRVSK